MPENASFYESLARASDSSLMDAGDKRQLAQRQVRASVGQSSRQHAWWFLETRFPQNMHRWPGHPCTLRGSQTGALSSYGQPAWAWHWCKSWFLLLQISILLLPPKVSPGFILHNVKKCVHLIKQLRTKCRWSISCKCEDVRKTHQNHIPTTTTTQNSVQIPGSKNIHLSIAS
jgi:hypothetical protein